MTNFYDKVGKKFGGYAFGTNKLKYTSEYPDADPEKVFKDKILELSSPNKSALDIGCGDGKFAFQITSCFAKIIGLDNSQELLKIALQKKKAIKATNIDFVFSDAQKTSLENDQFDIILNRRGPSFYKEYYRLLNKDGYYLEIGIGEKDTVDLKKIFGRGQNYGSWDKSRLKKNIEDFKKLGFKIIFAKDYIYTEYYLNQKEFDIFLQGVPIFEDYDSRKDKKYLDKYIEKFQTEKGIALRRHRVLYVLAK